MTYKREIENKFLVHGSNYDSACFQLSNLGDMIDSGMSKDYFWTSPDVDFVRLRERTNELTVKVSDKGIVSDRIEENVIVADIPTAKRYATLVHGPSVGTIEKAFSVFTVGPCLVSVYIVIGHSEVFLEVEGDAIEDVEYISNDLSLLLDLEQVDVSLFEYFLGEEL